MKFIYTAVNQNGKKVEGELDVSNAAEALSVLASNQLKPLSLKQRQPASAGAGFGIFKVPIPLADKIFLTKYLALMLKIGTDLFKAIDILLSDADKPSVKKFLREIKANLEKGQPFHYAFQKHPESFSGVFVNLLKAGELSGKLEKTFEDLSERLQKDRDLKHEIKAALIYPVMLISVAVAVIFFLATFALPKISKMFFDSGFTPPLFSRVVFVIGDFLNANVLIILPAIFILVIASWIAFTRSAKLKAFIERIAVKIPLVGGLLKKIALQRFASTMSSLLDSGIPILEALEITAGAVGNGEIKSALMRISREGVSRGLTIGEAFKREPAFPKIITNLVSISEKSGNLANILKTLDSFYESDIKASLKILVSFLEPILLLFIGLSVGIIALAIIIPVYQLIGNF